MKEWIATDLEESARSYCTSVGMSWSEFCKAGRKLILGESTIPLFKAMEVFGLEEVLKRIEYWKNL